NDPLTRKSDHAALHVPPLATPPTSPPTALLSLPAVPHTHAVHKLLPPAPAALCDPASRSASAAVFSTKRRPPAPCTPVVFPPDVRAGSPPVLLHPSPLLPSHTPPAASPLFHPPAPPQPLPAPTHVRPTAPLSLPSQSDSPVSLPADHSALETRCSHPPDIAPGPPSCTSALPRP